ncbi:hypothetical protein M3J09_002284 [Ascochyta lentis]
METQHHDYGSAHQEFQSAEEDGSCFPATQKVQSVLRVYSCLPWELRDYIHTYCVQGSLDNEVVVRHASGRPGLPTLKPRAYWTECCQRSTRRLLQDAYLQVCSSRAWFVASIP